MPTDVFGDGLEVSRQNPVAPLFGLMLDYDGTLTPIVDDPGRARITPDNILVLKKLVVFPNLALAIVSGRSVKQLQEFLPELAGEKILLCGLHGGEIYDAATAQYLVSPPEGLKTVVDDLQLTLTARIAEENNGKETGFLLENKGHSLAVHYRQVSEAFGNRLIALCQKLHASDKRLGKTFRLQEGKKVIEWVPKDFDKGACVRFLLAHWQTLFPGRDILPAYIGDDLTDEAAFEAVKRMGGVSLCVGNTAGRKTASTVQLQNVDAVYDFFDKVLLRTRDAGDDMSS